MYLKTIVLCLFRCAKKKLYLFLFIKYLFIFQKYGHPSLKPNEDEKIRCTDSEEYYPTYGRRHGQIFKNLTREKVFTYFGVVFCGVQRGYRKNGLFCEYITRVSLSDVVIAFYRGTVIIPDIPRANRC